MRSMTTVTVLLLGAMFAVRHAAGEEEMSFKDGMNAVWKGHFNHLVKVIDGDLEKPVEAVRKLIEERRRELR